MFIVLYWGINNWRNKSYNAMYAYYTSRCVWSEKRKRRVWWHKSGKGLWVHMLLVLNHNYLSQEQAIIQNKLQFAINTDYSVYMGCKSFTNVKQFGSKDKFSESLWPFHFPELSACSCSMDNFYRHFKNESVETETILKFYFKSLYFQESWLFCVKCSPVNWEAKI